MTIQSDIRPDASGQSAIVNSNRARFAVLLVDDKPENLLSLEATLDGMGLNLVKANSGKEALRCVLDQDFAAVLLDVQMPGIDGFETARLIRMREKSRNTPIIFITAAGVSETHVSRGYSLGAVDYIIKPFEPESLRSKVAALVEVFKRTQALEQELREMIPGEERLNILIVDDEPSNLLAMETVLAGLGENILKARSGREALRCLLNAPVAVIVLDIHMPEMDGFELAELIRQNDRLQHIPIIFVTAVRQAAEDVARGYALGAMDYLFLPHTPEIILAKVKALLDLCEHHQALGQQVSHIQRLSMELEQSQATLRHLNETLEQQVAERTEALGQQLARMSLLNQISRSIAERLDLDSIFGVVVSCLETHLVVDCCSVLLCDADAATFTVAARGPNSQRLVAEFGIPSAGDVLPIQDTAFARCLEGQTVYCPDLAAMDARIPRKLLQAGLHSTVGAPLRVEGNIIGVLAAVREQPEGFSEEDVEFLQSLADHVALAAHQASLYKKLQVAYDELRATQQAVLQQERLRVVGQMASGVAHDINNALSPISGYAQLLLMTETNLSEVGKKHLTAIETAADDIVHIVARLREFYRPRDQQQARVPVDLNRLVTQVIDMTRPRWKDMPQQRGLVIDLRTQLQEDLLSMMAVESEIREALTNLIFNAVDAMPEGGVITIRTYGSMGVREFGGEKDAPIRPYTHTPTHVILEVADTGTGMDDETRRRCLEPFYSTKGERGTGLGLGMVYGVIQRHEGDIEIESEPGKGTTMRLIFPVRTQVAPTEVTQADSLPHGRHLRILYVDDEAALRDVMGEMLTADGHTVEVADGGQAGVDAFHAAKEEGEAFDVVLTDLGMPYVDGRQVARAVKQESPGTPVILFTGWGGQMKADDDVPEEVDEVLGKPPKMRELREAIARVAHREER